MAGICDDLRVIDLSSGATGGMATMVLADFGADVLKVEPPGGDPARSDASAPMWLRGKRSVTLDLAQAADRERLHALVRGADVVVASFKPGEAGPLAADYDTLKAINPGLVYCSITGWGPRGHYAQYPADPALVAAKTGRMQTLSGIVRREGPAFPASRTETHAASQSALSGILAALLVRARTGRGQLVETSLLQGNFPFDLGTLLRVQLKRKWPQHFQGDPVGTPANPIVQLPAGWGPADSMPALFYLPVMASDGRWIQFANLLSHLFDATIMALDLGEQVLGNPRFAGAPRGLTPEATAELRDMMLLRARERPSAEWMRRFRESDNVGADLVGTAQEGLSHPDIVANGEVIDLEHPRLGRVRQLGPLARFMETPATPTGYVAEPGEHTAQVLAEPPRPARTAPSMTTVTAAAAAAAPRHPLEGVTVLEFATVLATPLGCSLLADLGARVIKVEPTEPPDMQPPAGIGFGTALGRAKTLAGKESICLDLKSEQGQAIVSQLIERADVIIHNYRPGVPERLGIGYERARSLNPRIIHLSALGYGPDGPSSRRPAAHPISGAVTGAQLLQAGSGWPPADTSSLDGLREASRWLFRANDTHPDPNTSVVIVSTVLLALYARQRTGHGQEIALSMLNANGYMRFDDFLSYAGKPPAPTLDAGLHGLGPLYRLYRASAGWVFLALHDDREWAAFCRAAGRADLATDARFASAAARREHGEALSAALAALFQQRPAIEWERLLISAGVGCVEASTESAGVFFTSDEQMRANGFDVEADHIMWGRYQRWGPMVTFSETPGRYGGAVLAGQHTDAILAELGCSEAQIAELRQRGVASSTKPMDVGAPVAV